MLKMKSIIPTTLLGLFLVGCGSDSKDDTSEYSGLWYYLESDTYFDISNSGSLSSYSCTLNDGYVIEKNISGVIEGNSLQIIDNGVETSVFTLERDDTVLTIASDEITLLFEKSDPIPNGCLGNAIEISFSSPLEAIEGIETSFIVNFDYRLTAASADVEIGFTSDESGSYTISAQESFSIDESGLGSGSLMVDEVPVIFENLAPYYLHINMSPKDTEGPYSPYASDKTLISVSSNQ